MGGPYLALACILLQGTVSTSPAATHYSHNITDILKRHTDLRVAFKWKDSILGRRMLGAAIYLWSSRLPSVGWVPSSLILLDET